MYLKRFIFFVLSAVFCFSLSAITFAGENPRLISTEKLAVMLAEGNVSVVDLRSDLPVYLKDHIPQAVYLHFETLRAAGHGVPADMLSGETYANIFSQLGFAMNKPVVIYSAGESNNFFATFPVWLLDGFGHEQVYLLDGGYEKWVKEGRPVTGMYPTIAPAIFQADSFKPTVASRHEVEEAMKTGSALLVDARPLDQFSGKTGFQIRKGHIPGAINHFWASDLMPTEHGNVWKPTDELRNSYEKQGITPDKQVIAYCNTGTEATHVYFALVHLLGYENVSVYVPSFTEWAEIMELPVAQSME